METETGPIHEYTINTISYKSWLKYQIELLHETMTLVVMLLCSFWGIKYTKKTSIYYATTTNMVDINTGKNPF